MPPGLVACPQRSSPRNSISCTILLLSVVSHSARTMSQRRMACPAHLLLLLTLMTLATLLQVRVIFLSSQMYHTVDVQQHPAMRIATAPTSRLRTPLASARPLAALQPLFGHADTHHCCIVGEACASNARGDRGVPEALSRDACCFRLAHCNSALVAARLAPLRFPVASARPLAAPKPVGTL